MRLKKSRNCLDVTKTSGESWNMRAPALFWHQFRAVCLHHIRTSSHVLLMRLWLICEWLYVETLVEKCGDIWKIWREIQQLKDVENQSDSVFIYWLKSSSILFKLAHNALINDNVKRNCETAQPRKKSSGKHIQG